MTVICQTRKHKTMDADNSISNVYGISIFRKHDLRVPIETIQNIFLDLTAAEDFCRLVNTNAVDELHIHDILEDVLASI